MEDRLGRGRHGPHRFRGWCRSGAMRGEEIEPPHGSHGRELRREPRNAGQGAGRRAPGPAGAPCRKACAGAEPTRARAVPAVARAGADRAAHGACVQAPERLGAPRTRPYTGGVSSLPTGTVTLLFTDIESSTRLVQELGDAYTQVLSDHRRLVRDAVAEAGGREVDCRADEFFVAFEEAEAALAAAVAAQRSLAAAGWPEGAAVRVRMGMHTGRPVLADDTYYGIDVHRAARICRSGHGGQVLVSAATREALYGAGLGGAELRDLGEHELKGLPQPERIFQVVADGLEGSFPPLREADLGATAT